MQRHNGCNFFLTENLHIQPTDKKKHSKHKHKER